MPSPSPDTVFSPYGSCGRYPLLDVRCEQCPCLLCLLRQPICSTAERILLLFTQACVRFLDSLTEETVIASASAGQFIHVHSKRHNTRCLGVINVYLCRTPRYPELQPLSLDRLGEGHMSEFHLTALLALTCEKELANNMDGTSSSLRLGTFR